MEAQSRVLACLTSVRAVQIAKQSSLPAPELVVAVSVRQKRHSEAFRTTATSPNYVDSKLVPIWVLLAYRILSSVYCLAIYLYRNISYFQIGYFYAYFTNLSYLILTIYFIAISFKSIIFIAHSHGNRRLANDRPLLMTPRPVDLARPATGFWNYLLLILFTVAVLQALFLDLTAWIVLPNYDRWIIVTGQQVTYDSIQVHAINAIQVLMEIFLGLMPIIPYMVIWPAIFVILYMGFTFVYFAKTTIWVYPFERWDQDLTWLIYLGVGGLFAISWLIICLFGWIRDHKIPDLQHKNDPNNFHARNPGTFIRNMDVLKNNLESPHEMQQHESNHPQPKMMPRSHTQEPPFRESADLTEVTLHE
ncbi:hypothetical protein SeMB42_g03280 [Synchytrium endobioticum]|uniref:Uncharacterized protein n=1 Tax=Synchytrium endobioticum TaxID=286115 RepID=A0A507D821_9FUNG|nr:hypothetical protein SeMB42_g03280 [Synchytrium endobioticum]